MSTINEYVINGGKLFIIKSIDVIRDGRNRVVDTTIGKFYIHKDTKKFHSAYPPSDENLITDSSLVNYLIEQIEEYIGKCERDVARNKNLLTEIKDKKNNYA